MVISGQMWRGIDRGLYQTADPDQRYSATLTPRPQLSSIFVRPVLPPDRSWPCRDWVYVAIDPFDAWLEVIDSVSEDKDGEDVAEADSLIPALLLNPDPGAAADVGGDEEAVVPEVDPPLTSCDLAHSAPPSDRKCLFNASIRANCFLQPSQLNGR